MASTANNPAGFFAFDVISKPIPYAACRFWVLPNRPVCETIFSGKFAVNRSFE
jgi:hypothetical protein